MYLISTFATSDVNHNITIRVLGNGLRNNSLAASKSTRDGSGTSLNTREECVQDTLTSKKRVVCCVLLGCWPRCAHRPYLHHSVLGRLALKLSFKYDVLNEVLMNYAERVVNVTRTLT